MTYLPLAAQLVRDAAEAAARPTTHIESARPRRRIPLVRRSR